MKRMICVAASMLLSLKLLSGMLASAENAQFRLKQVEVPKCLLTTYENSAWENDLCYILDNDICFGWRNSATETLHLFPVFQTTWGGDGAWGIYDLSAYPDAETVLPEWVSENLPGWECRKTEASAACAVDTLDVHPNAEMYGNERVPVEVWMSVCDRIYETFGYELLEPRVLETSISISSHFGTGDLNADGSTDIADAVALARFNAEDTELDTSALNMDEADLNADGTVDALDLAELLKGLAEPA